MNRPSREELAWVEASTGAKVLRTRRLTGGIASAVHAVTVESRSGRRSTFVLRRYPPDESIHGDGRAELVENEARTLTALRPTGLPVPDVVASDASGDTPRLLMTMLPGKLLLTARDVDSWLRQMAAALPRIHAVSIDVRTSDWWIDPARLQVPQWATKPDIWRRAFEIVSERPPADDLRFVHGDFQHFNVLWIRERLTGLLDWVYARWWYPDFDVAHCRLNLAALFSAERAERFREAYEAEAGRLVDPRVDLCALMNYSAWWHEIIPVMVGKLAPVDLDGMDERVEDLVERVVRRADS